jgi:hypothetical protein
MLTLMYFHIFELEDKISNVFLLGELIGLLQAKRTGRALEEAICYRNFWYSSL